MTRPVLLLLAAALAALAATPTASGFGIPPPPPPTPPPTSPRSLDSDRRSALAQHAGATSLLGGLVLGLGLGLGPAARPANAAGHTVDYTLFKKSLFNKPPGLLQFPAWMEGEWDAAFTFVGADFPSSVPPTGSGGGTGASTKIIPKASITADTTLPGFRRLSIAMVPDVGKPHRFRLRFQGREDDGGARVEEDRAFNLKEALESEVGKGAVAGISYDGDKNPNRITINLLPQAAVNAQKIELFCNARAPLPPAAGEEGLAAFRYVEDIRQVSISSRLAETSTVGDYRHVWELYRQGDGAVRGFLSTIAYATPQDPIFQLGAFAPLVVYFHTFTMARAAA